jgi:lipopolysaccharide transport system ATP-binding protein
MNDRHILLTLSGIGRKYHSTTAAHKGTVIAPARNAAFWALRDVSCTVCSGETVGIIGRNGAGKSTLLAIIAGTLPFSEGTISRPCKVSGLLALGAGFQDEFTGRENILLNAKLLGYTSAQIEEAYQRIVDYSELGDFINAPLGSYSAGMKMRLGFSVAVHTQFDVLVTDEILTVGDVAFQKKCFESIAGFKRGGKAMVIATQDMSLVERFCDRVLVLEDGYKVFEGAPKEGIDKYYQLLNQRHLLSEAVRLHMTHETKRWATDMDEWGKKEGTREITIDSVEFLSAWRLKTSAIKPNDALTVRVAFSINAQVRHAHFGVAVFREDGVYCYGPNTKIDGVETPPMTGGSGILDFFIPHFPFSPGNYYFAVAIWDDKEYFAYDYHKCSYTLQVSGHNPARELCSLRALWSNNGLSCRPDKSEESLVATCRTVWGKPATGTQVTLTAVCVLDQFKQRQDFFVTGRPIEIKVSAESVEGADFRGILWIGIFRSDGVYCTSFATRVRIRGDGACSLILPECNFLPGGYLLGILILPEQTREPVAAAAGVHGFHMISDKKDHGTVFADHAWRFKMKRGGADHGPQEK